MSEEHPLIGKVLAEDYRIIAFLGKGGMGSVFVAEQPSLNRKVAIKLLPSFDLTSEELHRFELEIASMATLNHPNIVTVHHRGRCGDPPTIYYVMELLEGGALRNYLQRFGKIPPILTLRLIRPVAEALAFAHERGYIHRDIKPDNLLFTSNYRSLKIADFGIAKLKEERGVTKSKAMLGTFLYAAPEQMQWYETEEECKLDERVDQYSLGVVLYEMLAGRVPYQAKSLMGMIKALSRSPVSLAKVAAHVPKSLVWLVETMIAKDPNNRFLDDESLLDAFTTVELEVASSVSTRIFAVKSDEISMAFPPTSGLFPSPIEKTLIQSMETQCVPYASGSGSRNILQSLRTWLEKSNERFGGRRWNALAIVGIFLLIAIGITYLIINRESPDAGNSEQEHTLELAPPLPPPPKGSVGTVSLRALRIVALPVPPPPKDYPHELQIRFISRHSKDIHEFRSAVQQQVTLEGTIPPGEYDVSVDLEGYDYEKGEAIPVSPGNDVFHLTLRLTANPRKVSPKIFNTNSQEEVEPLIFKIDNKPIVERVKPGKHHLYALFDFYQELNTTIEIEAGKETFQHRAPLIALQQYLFKLTARARKPDGDFYDIEAYIGESKVHLAHLKCTRDGECVQGYVWIPPHAKDLTFRSGYYYATVVPKDIESLTGLEELDGNRLLIHLKQFEKNKDLRGELDALLKRDSAKIAAFPSETLNRIYEFLKDRTPASDYKKNDSLWEMRRLVNAEEREEHKLFQECQRRAQKYTDYEERVILWNNAFLQKYPQGVYRELVESFIAYSQKVADYEQLFKKSLQECVLSPGEKNKLKEAAVGLQKRDIEIVRQKIARYLKERNCNQTLEEIFSDY